MTQVIDLHRRLFIAVCAATCTGAASTRPPVWPEGFSVVTIEGKRTYKILRAGPMFGKDKIPLGIGILYATASTDPTALKTAAADLFTYVLPQVERQHADGVAVLAQPGWNVEGKSITIGIVYKLQQDGWHVTPFDETKAVPRVERAIDAQVEPDRGAEAKAKASVESWLQLMDKGDLERAWETAAPLMNAPSMKKAWTDSFRTMHDQIGTLASRASFSTTEIAEIPGLPRGKYVIQHFRSRFGREPAAVEEVVAVLCDDGQWRVAGYLVYTGEPFKAKIVVDPHQGP
jgi:hypothetical protein